MMYYVYQWQSLCKFFNHQHWPGSVQLRQTVKACLCFIDHWYLKDWFGFLLVVKLFHTHQCSEGWSCSSLVAEPLLNLQCSKGLPVVFLFVCLCYCGKVHLKLPVLRIGPDFLLVANQYVRLLTLAFYWCQSLSINTSFSNISLAFWLVATPFFFNHQYFKGQPG